MKRIISILLAAVTVLLTLPVLASADTLTDIDIVPGKVIDFSITGNNTYTDTFVPSLSKSGEYTFISFGDVCPTVTVTYYKQTLIGREKVTDTIKSDGGVLFDTYTFSAGVEYTISVGGTGSFSLIFFKPNAEKCGFVSGPDKTEYFNKLEVSISGSNVTFLNDCLDLTGASFALVDEDGNTVYTVSGNSLKKIIKSVTYENNTIKLAVNASKKFLGITLKEYSAISLSVKPYPIKSVVLNHDELRYTYGDNDGTIKGSLKEHYFVPNINFAQMTATVTLTDGTRTENVPIQVVGGKYYFEVEGVGKVYITNEAKCPEKGENIDADIRIGADPYKLTVTIDKADFFTKIGIFFRLLFGVYKR